MTRLEYWLTIFSLVMFLCAVVGFFASRPQWECTYSLPEMKQFDGRSAGTGRYICLQWTKPS